MCIPLVALCWDNSDRVLRPCFFGLNQFVLGLHFLIRRFMLLATVIRPRSKQAWWSELLKLLRYSSSGRSYWARLRFQIMLLYSPQSEAEDSDLSRYLPQPQLNLRHRDGSAPKLQICVCPRDFPAVYFANLTAWLSLILQQTCGEVEGSNVHVYRTEFLLNAFVQSALVSYT
jgi:hypothetical protein